MQMPCRTNAVLPSPGVRTPGALLLFLLLGLFPLSAAELLDIGGFREEAADGTVLRLELAGPATTVIPTRVGSSLRLLFPERTLRWSGAALDGVQVEASPRGGRVSIDLGAETGSVDLEARGGSLVVRCPRGAAPAYQTLRPVRLDPDAEIEAPSEPPPAPRAASPPASPPAPAAEPAPPPAESAGPTADPPPAAAMPPHPGWGLLAVERGFEMRLVPLRGHPSLEKLPPEIRESYLIFVATGRVAKESKYIFRFRQRPGRFVLTLADGRQVSSLAIDRREDLLPLSSGDPTALFEQLDLYPGASSAGPVVFPRVFELDDVRRVEVRVRGELYEMPAVKVRRGS